MKWQVQVLGHFSSTYEVSVIRDDHENKLVLFDSINQPIWPDRGKALIFAHEVAVTLNKLESNEYKTTG